MFAATTKKHSAMNGFFDIGFIGVIIIIAIFVKSNSTMRELKRGARRRDRENRRDMVRGWRETHKRAKRGC